LTASAQTSDRRRWIALVVLCLGQLMIVLDATIVNVALPSIQGDLGFTQASLTWVVNAYLIAFGSFLLLAGRLGDLVGRKKVFIGGLALFTTASALCGLADDQALLIAARFVQGMGGAVASSVIIAIIVTEFRERSEQARAMGVFTFVASAGGSIGLLAGGVLTHLLSWHWIFFINVPIGIAAIGLGLALIEENEGAGLRQGVDVLGAALITLAGMLLVYAIVQTEGYGWGSPRTLVPGVASLAMIGGFFAYEARIENPIMPLRVFALRSLMAANAVRGLLVVGMFSSFFLGALYLEHVLGFSPIRTGLAFLPMTLAIGALSVGVTPRLLTRFGPKRTLVPGLGLAFVGLLLFARVPVEGNYWRDLFPAFLLLGLGAGTSFMPLITLAMSEVPKADAGLGSGLINTAQQMSAAIGVAALGTVAASRTADLLAAGDSQPAALTAGFHLSFAIATACVAIAIVLAVVLLQSPAGEPGPEEEPGVREELLADEMV
jgi:EmrB/QacA subfamily drug resistance transporter